MAPKAPNAIPSPANSKAIALISAPAPKARTIPICRGGQLRAEASTAPRTNEEAASVPQASAASIAVRSYRAAGARRTR
jgi:hypothetical protein